MREVGIAVWVILLVVGVVGSMVSSVRRQMQTQARAPRRLTERPRPFGPPAAVPVAASPPVAPPPGPPVARRKQAAPPAAKTQEVAHEPVRRPSARLFSTKGELVRAVIAAEVLGKPRGLSDEYFPH